MATVAGWSATWCYWTNSTSDAADNTTCARPGTSGTNYEIWVQWNGTSATANTGDTVPCVWISWISDTSPIVHQAAPAIEITGEMRRRAEAEGRELAREQAGRERAERRRKREQAAASKRAHRLLVSCLSRAQRREYRDARYFTVISADGERRYRVCQGFAGNVELVDAQGKRLRRYCIHPSERVPDEDSMLAQKLLLEADEPAFLQVANAW